MKGAVVCGYSSRGEEGAGRNWEVKDAFEACRKDPKEWGTE